jgi:predicted phosphodiesterase
MSIIRTLRESARWRVAALLVAVWLAYPCSAGTLPGEPTRILLGFIGDPATTQAVTWRTLEPVQTPQAQITADGAGPITDKTARSVLGESARVAVSPGAEAFHHAVAFSGLTPATRYAYRVGDGKIWSAWHAFTTASVGAAPFRFIYLGDAQNGLADVWPRVVRAAQAWAPDARLIAHAGDLLAEGYDDGLWGQWVSGLGPLAASVPNLAVPGNHDEHRAPGTPSADTIHGVSDLWHAHFRLPLTGPADLPDLAGQNYWLDYQGVRFIAIDANPFANEDYLASERARVRNAQLAWLETALTTNPNPWTIVVQHQPLYAVAKDRDYPELRDALGTLYDRYHVDLVLQGHDHMYARTHKVRGGHLVGPTEPGVIYVISVSGAKMYTVTNRRVPLMACMAEGVQAFQVISVSGARLEFTSRAADGVLLDRFRLEKTRAGTRYVNDAGASEARR